MQRIEGFTVKRVVELNLSAETWQLYTSMKESSAAAKYLNLEVAAAINGSFSKSEASEKVAGLLSKYSKYGACDSEPYWVASQILDQSFPEEN